MAYEFNINAGVTGTSQIEQLGAATDKQTERAKRVAEAVQGYIDTNSKLSAQQARLALDEVKLEQLRERSRLATQAAAAGAMKAASAQDALAAGNTRVASSSMAASAALRVMEGAMPLRAAASFLGSMQGIGAAMQVAFPIFGAIALVEVFGKIATGAQKFIKDLEEGPTRIQQHFRELNATFQMSNDELRLSNDRMADTIAKLEHKPRNLLAEALDEARVNADKLAVSLGRDLDRVEELIKKNAVGGFGQMVSGARSTSDIEAGYKTYQRHVDDINYTGNLAVHAATTKEGAKAAQDAWNTALAAALSAEQLTIRAAIAEAKAPHTLQLRNPMTGTVLEAPEQPGVQAGRLAMLQGLDMNLTEQSDAAALRTQAAALQGELPIARANAEAGRKAAEEAKQQARARLALTRKTDQWLEQQRKQHEEMLNREGIEITKDSAKVFGEDLKEAMKEGGADMARFFPHEVAPLTGMETMPQYGARMAHQQRMAGIASRPGQEAALAAQQANARLTSINTIRDRELSILDVTRDAAKIADIRNKADLEAAETRYEFEEKITELAKRQKEETVSMAVGLVMAAQHGGAAGFVKSQLEGIESKVLTNAARMVMDSPTGKSITDKLHAQSGGMLDKLLAGTPFAADPMKSALDRNTDATNANTLAMGGSAGGVAGGGAGSTPSSLLRKLGILDKFGGSVAGGGYQGTGMTQSEWNQAIGSLNTETGPDAGPGGGSSTIAASGVASGGGMSGAARGFGIAGAAAAGFYGAYSGFHSGGARGALTGAGSILGAAGAIMPLISASLKVAGPIGLMAGMGLGMIASMLGDPKQIKQQQIATTLRNAQFLAPVSVNATMGTGGGYSDMDRFGNVRDSSFSPFPSVEQGYFDYRHGTVVGGRTLSNFGGPSGSATVPHVVVNVNALDAKSILDRHGDIADAVARAMDLGSSPSYSEALSRRSA